MVTRQKEALWSGAIRAITSTSAAA
jgi:hypothetical protein